MSTDALHPRFAAAVPDALETRRVATFLGVTFTLNWLPAVYFLAAGVTLTAGDRQLPTVALTATLVAASFSPAVGHLLTRWLTGEGFDRESLLVGFALPERWRTYAVALLAPFALAVVGAGAYFAAFPGHLAADPLAAFVSASALTPLADRFGAPAVALAAAAVTVVSSVPGVLFVLGEEFGWRAYLFPKLAPLGLRRAALVTGLVWGIWHWPYVALGLNYGLEYPGAPWLGMAAMAWTTVLYGVLLAWATARTGSVWPAALGHAAFNASARWGYYVAADAANPALGPQAGSLLGTAGWLVVAAWLLVRAGPFRSSTDAVPAD